MESLRSVLREQILEGVPTGWKKGSIQVATRSGKETVDGYSKGNIAVHKPTTGKGWNITHAPSGMAMVTELVTQDAAMTIADHIAEKFPELVKADAKQVQSIAKSKGRDIAQLIKTLKASLNKRKLSAKQIAKQAEDSKAEKANKAFYDKIGDTYQKLFLQFIRYGEQAGIDITVRWAPRDVSKDLQGKIEAIVKAYAALRWVQEMLRFAEKGLYDNEHRAKFDKAVKDYESAMAALKKVGVDITKTPEKVQTYVVTWDQGKFRRDSNLGNAGPDHNGIIVDAASAHEAEVKVGNEHNYNPFYLKATVLK